MVMFNSYVTNYQRVYDSLISPFKHLFSCLGDFLASHDYQRVNPFWGCFSHSIKMKMIHVSKV